MSSKYRGKGKLKGNYKEKKFSYNDDKTAVDAPPSSLPSVRIPVVWALPVDLTYLRSNGPPGWDYDPAKTPGQPPDFPWKKNWKEPPEWNASLISLTNGFTNVSNGFKGSGYGDWDNSGNGGNWDNSGNGGDWNNSGNGGNWDNSGNGGNWDNSGNGGDWNNSGNGGNWDNSSNGGDWNNSGNGGNGSGWDNSDGGGFKKGGYKKKYKK